MRTSELAVAVENLGNLVKKLNNTGTSSRDRSVLLNQMVTVEQELASLLTVAREREVIALMQEQDLSFSQLSEILGISKGRAHQIVVTGQKRQRALDAKS